MSGEQQRTQPNMITIIEIGHNSSPLRYQAADRQVTMARYKELLKDPGQTDSPLLTKLGYPVVIVSTTPGRKCIPEAQVVAVGNNPQNNRMATVAAARYRTGLALGCVVGNVFALRTDGKDLTANEWFVLWDILLNLMDEYGEGPGTVNDRLMAEYKATLRQRMRSNGLLPPSGSGGAGAHCWSCGVQEDRELELLRCSRCKTARYCSKDCQKQHWHNGHKEECKPYVSPDQAEADKVQQLLETAVLKPEQIIAYNVPPPPMPFTPPPCFESLMGPEETAVFLHNKQPGRKERICPSCMTQYRLQDPAPDDQCAREQELSGICSYRCWGALNPPGSRHATPELYGQSAMHPSEHGVQMVM